ncbi:asparagine synthase [Pisolithus thermaeus]|nr:asparagine synthase [Pisolithus thermaeus]
MTLPVVDSGAQPLVSNDGKVILVVNGEIYNHLSLRSGLGPDTKFETRFDCEVIIPLYRKHDKDLCIMLDGMFSFVVLDESVTPTRIIAARDPIGITTLYQGWNSKKPGSSRPSYDRDEVISFPPGYVYDSQRTPAPISAVDYTLLRDTLEAAVQKRLMSEVPYGVLLSGGLDSSLIAAIAARETDKLIQAHGPSTPKWDDLNPKGMLGTWPQLHSFSIRLEHSPYLPAARKAANFLGTNHHEFVFTVQEGLGAIPDATYHLETYDVTTVCASTPMYLLSRKIKAMGVKMVLSGEGSDEIFGGYLYFHAAPDSKSFHQECIRRVKHLHTADCFRANKSTMAWGLEVRVPFLDKEFLEVAMSVDPKDRIFSKGSSQELDSDGCPKMEKCILRKAFEYAPDGKPYLPKPTLWRQMEQFSDGVGHSWIDGMKDYAATIVSDEAFAKRTDRWQIDTSDTKEAYCVREIFEGVFCAWTWRHLTNSSSPPGHFLSDTAAKTAVRLGCSSDPSGRSISIHSAAYQATE